MIFRRLVFLGICLCVFSLAATASAEVIAQHRKGLDLGLHTGVNFCVDDGQASCEGLGVGGGIGLIAGIRPIPYFSVDFDLAIHTVSQDDAYYSEEWDEVDVTNAMLMLQAYLPIQYLDVYAKAGWGYSSWRLLMGDERLVGSSWKNFKLGGGVNAYFLNEHRLGDMGVGLDFSYMIINENKLEYCHVYDCQTMEEDYEADAWDAMQVSLNFNWILPVF